MLLRESLLPELLNIILRRNVLKALPKNAIVIALGVGGSRREVAGVVRYDCVGFGGVAVAGLVH